MEYSSRLLENAIDQFARLPGIGRRTALRLVLHLLRQDSDDVALFTEAIRAVRNDIHYCGVCHNISDEATCAICSDRTRDAGTVCAVESVRDVMAVEATRQYHGLYHVLGGVISPLDGVGPDDLNIGSLVSRVAAGGVGEVILALSPTLEGDTTNSYIYDRLRHLPVRVTTLARGVAIGDELQYADELTLGRSIVDRVPFA